MEWTGSICWIHNPVQFRRIWIGTGSEIYQLSGFWIGLDREMCKVYPIFRDLRQFFLIVTLILKFYPQIFGYTHSFVLTCSFYKVFDRFLLFCVWIGLDWIKFLGHQLDWTGLGSMDRGFGLDWILSTQSISYFGGRLHFSEYDMRQPITAKKSNDLRRNINQRQIQVRTIGVLITIMVS